MIKNLFIKNYAIIDDLSIDFYPGLTVITGETGSGKSIIIEAMSVATGKKVDKMMVKSNSKHSVIDLEFEKDSYRRIINISGRSRSFINDMPASINKIVKDFEQKIDFHGQHDQQLILKKENHIDYLDYFCKHQDKVNELIGVFNNLEKCKKQLKQLKQDLLLSKEKKELINFQLNEIESAGIIIEEETKLLIEYKKLNHQEEILSFFNNLQLKLNNHDKGILSELNNILNKIESLKKYDDNVSRLANLFNSIVVQLQDVDSEINSRLGSDEFDEARLSFIEQRITVLETLKRKYGGTLESVVAYGDQISQELDEISSLIKSDLDINKNIEELEDKYNELATKLSTNRKNKKADLSKLIEASLSELNMERARFSIEMSSSKKPLEYSSKGVDQIEFLLSANPGEPLKPMTAIASGGEMSRIMLAIKTVFQDQNPIDTLIFDEIDTGISGETAKRVSNHLKTLSNHKQVICITHLPQIARKADNHLHITKKMDSSNTIVKAEYMKGRKSKQIINNLFVGNEVVA